MDSEDRIVSRSAVISNPSARCVVSEYPEAIWSDVIAGEKQCVRIASKDVGGRYTILESIAQPGAASPRHFHREEEVFQIMEGVLALECNGEEIEASAETIVVIPAGAHHAWANRTDRPVRMRVTFAPGGLEDLFAKAASLSMPDLIELAESYGTFVVGPPMC